MSRIDIGHMHLSGRGIGCFRCVRCVWCNFWLLLIYGLVGVVGNLLRVLEAWILVERLEAPLFSVLDHLETLLLLHNDM